MVLFSKQQPDKFDQAIDEVQENESFFVVPLNDDKPHKKLSFKITHKECPYSPLLFTS